MTVPAFGGGGEEVAPQIASSAWLQPMTTHSDVAAVQDTPLVVVDDMTPLASDLPEELTTEDASASEPEPADSVEPWATMVIRSGDTLFDLADWFGVQPTVLAEANGISLDSFIVTGQMLVVPVPESVFVLPPEPVQVVVQAVDVVEDVESTSFVEPLAEPEPVIVAPPASGGDVVAIICALPWPCEQMVAIATCESGLNPSSFNPAGYYGLFQISYSFDGWDDPVINAQVAYEQKYLPALASGDPFSPWPICRWY
jgi:LysM repeat protein